MAKSFKTEFVKYYKEKLEPLGFVKVKGAQPYFVRVVKDEILHIITYMEVPSTQYGYKSFHLMCGVATVYRKEINFTVSPKNNSDWLVALGTVNEKKDTEFPLVTIPRDLKIFYYNTENIEEVLKETWEGAIILLKELDKVIDMDKVLWYLLKYNAGNITFRRGLDESFFDEEGLYFARRDFDYSIVDRIFEGKRFELLKSKINTEEKERRTLSINTHEQEMKKAREIFQNNEEDYKRGLNLLAEHYYANVDKLYENGVELIKKSITF